MQVHLIVHYAGERPFIARKLSGSHLSEADKKRAVTLLEKYMRQKAKPYKIEVKEIK
jgi:hypothetical protein